MLSEIETGVSGRIGVIFVDLNRPICCVEGTVPGPCRLRFVSGVVIFPPSAASSIGRATDS